MTYNYAPEALCHNHLYRYFQLQPCRKNSGLAALLTEVDLLNNEYSGLSYDFQFGDNAITLKIKYSGVYQTHKLRDLLDLKTFKSCLFVDNSEFFYINEAKQKYSKASFGQTHKGIMLVELLKELRKSHLKERLYS